MNSNPCKQVFEPLLNSEDVAKLLGVNKVTLQRMARAGQLPCIKVGKSWPCSLSQLDTWIASATTCDRK